MEIKFPISGCTGYMSTYMKIYPEIAQQYWSAVDSRDLSAAWRIARQYDVPLFDYIMQLPGDFNAGEHAALELYGIAGRWRRPPYYSLNDAELEQLAEFLRGLEVL